ncbi:hypothetical protein HMPREF9946_03392, partial [Acetobacteraceae bacterium AT-5844]
GAPEVHDLRRLRVQPVLPILNIIRSLPLRPEAPRPTRKKKRRGLGNSFPSLLPPQQISIRPWRPDQR